MKKATMRHRGDGYTVTTCRVCGAETILTTKNALELIEPGHYILCSGQDDSLMHKWERLGCQETFRAEEVLRGDWNPLRRRHG